MNAKKSPAMIAIEEIFIEDEGVTVWEWSVFRDGALLGGGMCATEDDAMCDASLFARAQK